MRRCYRSAALVLGGILLAGHSLLNSCSLSTLNVYAAEAALTEESKVIERQIQLVSNHTGEENVETETPADDPEPTMVGGQEENENSFYLKYKEYNVLLKIVEAEAGGEDIIGKMLVANVIMNRVNHRKFPDTVTEVVYQKQGGKAQFSPTVDGRIDSVRISQETIEAVERVMNGEDSSNGALYFRSVRSTGQWHDNSLSRMFEHGNHIFYTI